MADRVAARIIMLGPPGAGKGTQAEVLARELGVPKISTGDILREATARGTELGRRARAILEAGGLVGDDIMIEIVRERLARRDAVAGFVLDGFPRTVAQAEALDRLLGGAPVIVIELLVGEDELVRRLTRRRVCKSCGTTFGAWEIDGPGASPRCPRCGGELGTRADDREDVGRERFWVYERQTAPLVEFYRARPGFIQVDGTRSPAEVSAAVRSRLGPAPTRMVGS